MGAGSANCKVVARPPGRVCAQTPVAVKRVASLTCLDMAIGRGVVGNGRVGKSYGREVGMWIAGCQELGGFERSAGSGVERR